MVLNLLGLTGQTYAGLEKSLGWTRGSVARLAGGRSRLTLERLLPLLDAIGVEAEAVPRYLFPMRPSRRPLKHPRVPRRRTGVMGLLDPDDFAPRTPSTSTRNAANLADLAGLDDLDARINRLYESRFGTSADELDDEA
jgi:hypothetical protein